MTKPVVVSNVFPDDNKGGCAITLETIAWLKREFPGSPVYLVPVEQSGTYDPQRHRFTLAKHPDVRILRSPIRTDGALRTTIPMLARSLAMLAGRRPPDEFTRVVTDAALVVSKGGYVFVERVSLRNLLSLWFTAFPLIFASSVKAPTLALCTTVGPFRRAPSRLLCRWILGRVDAVVTRDPISTDEARRLGRADVTECPDIVLSGGSRDHEPAVPVDRFSGLGRYGVFVLSGTGPRQDEVFLERLVELARRVLDDGLVDRIVVPLQTLEDAGISARFLRAVGDDRCMPIDEDLSPEGLIALYRGARFLVGRRLHAALFAMLAGTPTFLFATDGVKATGVMAGLGLSSRLLEYPEFPVEEAHRLLVETMRNERKARSEVALEIGDAMERCDAALRGLGRRFQIRPRRSEPTESLG